MTSFTNRRGEILTRQGSGRARVERTEKQPGDVIITNPAIVKRQKQLEQAPVEGDLP